MHVGILEDDEFQLAIIHLWLGAANHSFSSFGSVAAAIEGLKAEHFDAYLLDWVLPDGTGAEVLRWIRQNLGWSMALLVLTGQDDEATVVEALQSGADDFVLKPPKCNELLARLESVARRAGSGGLQVLRMGAYQIDIPRNTLSIDGAIQTLTQKEFDLAVCLFQSPAKLLCRDHLLKKVWGAQVQRDTRTVDTHISRLRKKLLLNGTKGWKLSPVYGIGYRLDRIDPTANAKEQRISPDQAAR
jgi:DNA-binding response OmpR family regulator